MQRERNTFLFLQGGHFVGICPCLETVHLSLGVQPFALSTFSKRKKILTKVSLGLSFRP